jgi:sporulation protein YlmC with PRC-barrel domain
MKTNCALLGILIATWSVGMSVMAQQSDTAALNHFEKAGNILGMIITDSRDQRVGRVKELAIDWQAGRVAEVIVDTGGYLTSRQRIFDNAPEFAMSMFDDATPAASVNDVYERFHIQPYSPIGPLKRAAKIEGLSFRNRAERLGKVDDLVVELPSGNIPEVIIASSSVSGSKAKLTAVAPEAFLFNPDNDSLMLETTRLALNNAPHFKAGEWREAMAASQATAPADKDDAAITLAIEHKILATDGLSIDARQTQVVTRNGWVTLRGTADSDREKQQLGEIAASVVTASHVNNLVEVKLYARTASW